MGYISVKEAAEKWGLSARSVQIHCVKGHIPGVNLLGKAWQIPAWDVERRNHSSTLPKCSVRVI